MLCAFGFFISIGAHAQQAEYVTGTITTQNLVSAGVATAGSSVEIITTNKKGIVVQITGTYTGALSIQISVNNTTWVTLAGASAVLDVAGVVSPAATIASAAVGVYSVAIPGPTRCRVTALGAVTGSAGLTIRLTN